MFCSLYDWIKINFSNYCLLFSVIGFCMMKMMKMMKIVFKQDSILHLKPLDSKNMTYKFDSYAQ